MLFRYKVQDSFFPQDFEGEIESESREQAEQEIREWYAMELGDNEEGIEIIEMGEVE